MKEFMKRDNSRDQLIVNMNAVFIFQKVSVFTSVLSIRLVKFVLFFFIVIRTGLGVHSTAFENFKGSMGSLIQNYLFNFVSPC